MLIRNPDAWALKPGVRIKRIAKNNYLQKLRSIDCGVDFFSFPGTFWMVFLTVVALETRLGISGFSSAGDRFGARKAFQTLPASLEPAASGPMTAEKQPTWTDDY